MSPALSSATQRLILTEFSPDKITDMNNESMIILGTEANFVEWETDLQTELVKRGRLGHVFHDIVGIPPAIMPTAPERKDGMTSEEFLKSQQDYTKCLTQWLREKLTQKG